MMPAQSSSLGVSPKSRETSSPACLEPHRRTFLRIPLRQGVRKRNQPSERQPTRRPSRRFRHHVGSYATRTSIGTVKAVLPAGPRPSNSRSCNSRMPVTLRLQLRPQKPRCDAASVTRIAEKPSWYIGRIAPAQPNVDNALLGLGLGFESGAILADHRRPVAFGLHHDQPADPRLDSLQARRALPRRRDRRGATQA